MTQTAGFHVRIPLDRLEDARTALKETGIALDPVDDMLHLPADNVLYSVFTGADGHFVSERLNRHFRETGDTRRVPDFNTLSAEQRSDLLELATTRTVWNTDDRPGVEEIDDDALTAFFQTLGKNSPT